MTIQLQLKTAAGLVEGDEKRVQKERIAKEMENLFAVFGHGVTQTTQNSGFVHHYNCGTFVISVLDILFTIFLHIAM